LILPERSLPQYGQFFGWIIDQQSRQEMSFS
jgi:hypothetical protein